MIDIVTAVKLKINTAPHIAYTIGATTHIANQNIVDTKRFIALRIDLTIIATSY